MAIRFKCSSCQQTIKVDEKYAGRRAKCPGCSGDVTVPSAEKIAAARAKAPAAKSPVAVGAPAPVATATIGPGAKGIRDDLSPLGPPRFSDDDFDDLNPYSAPRTEDFSEPGGREFPSPAPVGTRYVGFWRRLAAYALDYVITILLAVGIGFVFGMVMVAVGLRSRPVELLGNIVGILVAWFYFAGAESSEHQATFGKRLIGAKVVDERGRRISFGRATGRYFAKIISALLLGYGFIKIAFSNTKQGLHDDIAKTYVVER